MAESTILGAPLSGAGVSKAIAEKHGDVEWLASRLRFVENHQAFALLKNCLVLPKLQYILRASPAYSHVDELSRLDAVVISALSACTNVQFVGDSLVQTVLPGILGGGVGVRMSRDIALPAFISSLYSTRALVESILCNVQWEVNNELELAVEAWQGNGKIALDEGADKCQQGSWDVPRTKSVAASCPGLVCWQLQAGKAVCGSTRCQLPHSEHCSIRKPSVYQSRCESARRSVSLIHAVRSMDGCKGSPCTVM